MFLGYVGWAAGNSYEGYVLSEVPTQNSPERGRELDGPAACYKVHGTQRCSVSPKYICRALACLVTRGGSMDAVYIIIWASRELLYSLRSSCPKVSNNRLSIGEKGWFV